MKLTAIIILSACLTASANGYGQKVTISEKNASLEKVFKEIKKSSNDFIRDKKFLKYKFNWQEGYGAFSYSHSQIDSVINYIMNQKEHHKKQTFREEYLDFLKKFEIDFKNDFLFKWIE